MRHIYIRAYTLCDCVGAVRRMRVHVRVPLRACVHEVAVYASLPEFANARTLQIPALPGQCVNVQVWKEARVHAHAAEPMPGCRHAGMHLYRMSLRTLTLHTYTYSTDAFARMCVP
jgi:hypothetical protein